MEVRGISDSEIDELNAELRRRMNDDEAVFCMVASEDVLRSEWETPEENEAWKDL